MRIALGSTRAAKAAAVRASAARVATIDPRWLDPEIIAIDVVTDAPDMPVTDQELLGGAMARAIAVRDQMRGPVPRRICTSDWRAGFTRSRWTAGGRRSCEDGPT